MGLVGTDNKKKIPFCWLLHRNHMNVKSIFRFSLANSIQKDYCYYIEPIYIHTIVHSHVLHTKLASKYISNVFTFASVGIYTRNIHRRQHKIVV